MINAGIIGGAGFTGGEVTRLLLHHPNVELSFVQSESQHGKNLYEVHNDLFGATELQFQKEIGKADVLFLCKGHGESKSFMEKTKIQNSTKIIDLSQDFRHKDNNKFGDTQFVYGLPELNKDKIKKADYIANPGCFATCIQLALLPLAAQGLLNSSIHVSATTGSTGAGQNLSSTNHFSWRNNNHSSYKALNHQHETEILESVRQLQSSFISNLNFIPQRGAFTRGIYAVTYVKGDFDLDAIKSNYETFYNKAAFTHLVPFDVDVKQVVNTNNCFIALQKEKDNLIIISTIDNLLKGAAGQAVQNMNLMFGLEETQGLKLKPSAF
jgi:N-acetyl-gamma-glutamyl-phosphate reductase